MPDGWFNHGSKLLALLEEYQPRVVVELGTWLGASAIPMARAVARWGGTVTCVDTWAGELNADGGSNGRSSPMMIWTCAREMVAAGVGANVRLIPGLTSEVAKTWMQAIDFLYVDADHSEAGVRADLEAWSRFIRAGGIIAGDDYGNDLYPGVKRAWDAFEREHEIALMRYQSHPPVAHGCQLVYGVMEG